MGREQWEPKAGRLQFSNAPAVLAEREDQNWNENE
jgi:hypothetical protein